MAYRLFFAVLRASWRVQRQPLHRGATSILCCLVSSLVVSGGDQISSTRQALDAAYRQQLEGLASKCDELGMAPQAAATRNWVIDRDPRRQYLFVPGMNPDAGTANGGTDLVQKWHARFMDFRRGQATSLFEMARREAQGGSATTAYQWLHEVLQEDRDHLEARRVLGISSDEELRPRSRVPTAAHPDFGWPRGRWWQIESSHFQVSTNLSSEAGMELARRLEEFYSVWKQLFFVYWAKADWLTERFAGESPAAASKRKHRVILFRDRREYVDKLGAIEPRIATTLGYYHKSSQSAFFYAGDDSLLSVRYHEAAHQLFQETGSPISDVGEKWNFWVVEGAAVYFESLVKNERFFTIGGFDADRLQFARTRVLGGEPQMPLDQLVRLGREELQQHADIRRLYTQAAAVTHFYLDFDGGRYRDTFARYLASVYAGRDTPDSLRSILGYEPARFEEELRSFLAVRDADLRYLGPPQRRRNLSLLRGDITDAALPQLKGSDRLEWLDLSYTGVTDQGLQQLPALGGLKRLALVGARIGDAAMPALTRFSALEELDLSGTAITDEALPQLARLTKLRVLRMSHTAVTDAGLPHLVALRKLEEIDVEQTSVTEPALARFKQRLAGSK